MVVTSPASDAPGTTPTSSSAPALFPILPLGPSADTAGNAHPSDSSGKNPVQYFNPGLQLFSVPFDYTGAAQTVNDVLKDFDPNSLMDLGNEGMLAVWDPASQSYALTPNGAAKQLALGQGYWGRFQYQPTGSGTLVETGLKTRGPLAQEITGRLDPQRRFSIALAPGWNMIGDPFAASVSLANVQAQAKDGTVYGLTDANNQGLLNQTFYKYAAARGAMGYVALSPVTNDKLDPYVGYWVHAYQPCTLLVPQP